MKKQVIAAAVAAGFAVPSIAQVTVYGVIDQSVGTYSKAAAGNVSAVASSVWATNRLGFRGEEDLGGGLKAGFIVESGFTGDHGGVSTAGSADTFQFGSRGIELSLSGGFGTVRIGKSSTSDLNSVASSFFVNALNFDATSATTAALSAGTLTLARPANRVQYATPVISGFQANVAYSSQADDIAETTTAATKNDGAYSNVGVSYAAGPLSLRVFQAQRDQVASSAKTTNKDMGASARYNLGIADVGIRYVQSDRVTGAGAKTVNSALYAVEGRVPFGNTAVVLGYLSGNDKTSDNFDYTRTVVAVENNLSKRTQAYALYSSTDNKAGSIRRAIPSAAAGDPTAATDPNAIVVGIRHSF